MAIALQSECCHAAHMDRIVNDGLEREHGALPIDAVRLEGVWRRASKDAAGEALKPAMIDILTCQETADVMSLQPSAIKHEAGRYGAQCVL